MLATDTIFYKKIKILDEIREVVLFQEKIWGSVSIVPLTQLVAACHHGGVLLGAYHGGKLVGFCYGFPGFNNNRSYLISHMTAVLPDYHNLGIGRTIKLKQREWAIEHGYEKIVWTYDPLEARNAYFNLNKLGAYAKTYIPSYYGEMNDNLNKGLPTDRLLAEWNICSERVTNALSELADGSRQEASTYQQLLETEIVNQIPYPGAEKQVGGDKGYKVSVAANFQDIKNKDFEAAKAWRRSLGNVLAQAMGNGYVVTGILRDGNELVHSYIVENHEEGRKQHDG